ncbi:hypothetical protein [Vibrio sp. CyArs1]|uniref:hypothetical protein n=1 Tax=Vibrio sp. CyArs1 TaxID=2682577 RepID=UPI001F05E558|nr:hypothetical protein [Vibrio sp. CyArs1]
MKDKHIWHAIDLILKCSWILPTNFRNKLKSHIEDYHYWLTREVESDEVDSISLLTPDADWRLKGVGMLYELSPSEVEIIQRWYRNNKFTSNNHEKNIDATNYGFGSLTLGNFVSRDKNTYQIFDIPVKFSSELIKRASVSVFSFEKGHFYLFSYTSFCDIATESLKNVDCKHLTRKVHLLEKNIFSHKFGAFSFSNISCQSKELITKKLDDLSDDVSLFNRSIQEELGLDAGISRVHISTMDIHSEDHFFKRDYNGVSHPNAVVWQKFHGAEELSDREEELLFMPRHEIKAPFDTVYIRTARSNPKNYSWDFKTRLLALDDSHHILSLIFNSEKKLEKLFDKISVTISKQDKIKKQKLYDDFYSHQIELKSIKQFIKSTKPFVMDALNSSDGEKYKSYIEGRYSNIEQLVEENEQYIIDSKERTNELIQIENLRYHKKYSHWVMILVLVQIALAIASIDWSSKSHLINRFIEAIQFTT